MKVHADTMVSSYQTRPRRLDDPRSGLGLLALPQDERDRRARAMLQASYVVRKERTHKKHVEKCGPDLVVSCGGTYQEVRDATGLHVYRRRLQVGPGPRRVVWLLANPGRALGRTMMRCAVYTAAWDYSVCDLVNVRTYEHADPAALEYASRLDVPLVAPRQEEILRETITGAALVMMGWGDQPTDDECSDMLGSLDRYHDRGIVDGAELSVLALTGAGRPMHPLYVPMTATPVAWCLGIPHQRSTPRGLCHYCHDDREHRP
jgi:hypothetical protein